MLLLAFDTATPAVTVALHDGAAVLASRTAVDARRHAELLAPAIQEVLGEAGTTVRDLTDVAVGVGPGPFTGLRVGLVTARSLRHALGVHVHGLCTLDALASEYVSGYVSEQASGHVSGSVPGPASGRDRGEPFLVATDARRREVYWARYDGAGRRVSGPAVDRPAEVPGHGLAAVGEGAAMYTDAFPLARPPVLPSAAALADLAVSRMREAPRTDRSPDSVDSPEPLYLRRPDARVPGHRKPVTPERPVR